MLGSGLCRSMAMARVRRAWFHGGGLGGGHRVTIAVATGATFVAMTTMVAARETTVAPACITADSNRGVDGDG
jgi:predicted aspartyl protease